MCKVDMANEIERGEFMTNKELEVMACKTFVCPNLGLIVQKGKELQLRDETINKARDIAVEYFKKTYHMPIYSSVKNLLPSFLYLASILGSDRNDRSDRRTQEEVKYVFDITIPTMRRWNRHIIDTLELDM